MEELDLRVLTKLESSVIKTLVYFNLFRYPLLKNEIHLFLPYLKANAIEVKDCLEALAADGLIHFREGYYQLTDDTDLVTKREKGNKIAAEVLKKAIHYSSLISKFPFVEAVCISGSLSKGYMDEKGDIDYFIITKPKKLWIARTILILFKKIFLLNRHKHFCLNYFIDTDHLEIPDKNIFTATEITSLWPMVNQDVIEKFYNSNQWTGDFLPNGRHSIKHITPLKKNRLGTGIEKMLSNSLGDLLDRWFMNMTLKRWNRKFGHFKDIDFELALRSRKYVSKHHPLNFQQKVLNGIAAGISEFEARHQVKLQNG